MDDDQQFCLRWNNHQSTLISVFDTLLENETLVDCTLAAEGKFLKAHKVVLSACSPYFATLLQEQYDKHPIFILKDVKYQELRAMMDYMYRGEVNISQDQLAALLKAAESLQIKGLSDNRTGGGAAPKPESSGQQQHHRGGKLSGAYTLEQTKRARLATGGAMDTSGDVSGSREGSSSPSRRRRKVRRRSMENDAHDNSNSSVLQAAASNQSILQQTGAGLAVSALVSTQLASGPAAGTSSSQASSTQQQQQPLTSTNVTKKTESAKLTSSTAAPASGASASAAAVQQAHLQQQHQQAQTTSDAINTENVQAQSQGGAQGVQGDDEDMDEGSAVGGASAASGPNPASASASAVHAGVVVKQLASVVDKSSSNHKQKIKDNSVSSVGSEMVIEPKAEYDDDAHDENVEDLTLDEEDMTMEELDQTAGTSQGGEGSSQTYATWQHDRSQDELGILGQDAQQRDPQDGYWTILETVPYSIASAAPNQTLSTATTLSNGGSGLLTGATVVVELPPDDLGNPVGNIQYTIPALTKNATTNTTTTSLLHKPQATTIQIVKQQHQQHQQQQHQQQHQQHQQQHRQHLTIQQPQAHAHARQEYIKIDTSRLEDKMLLRDVMQYGSTSIAMAPQSATTTTVVSTHESALLLTDADEAERELELEAMKVDQHNEDHLLDDEGYVVEKMHDDGEQQVHQQQEKLYMNGISDTIHTATTMTLQQVDYPLDDCKYACNVCGKTYKIKGSLKRHKNYECGVEPNLKCPHCPHKCKYRSDLRKHMNQKHADSGEAILGT
nr:longitudinals lacking protein, isoforms N/O/W/X/Y isoform X5 [Drosophila suzukii]